MTEMNPNTAGPGFVNYLQNTGAPQSRVRVEPVNSSMLTPDIIRGAQYTINLNIPDNIMDIEKWLLNKAKRLKLSDWQEIAISLHVPQSRMIAFPYKTDNHNVYSDSDILFAAAILSRTSGCSYLPTTRGVFTRKRLNRSLKLITINIDAFYELD